MREHKISVTGTFGSYKAAREVQYILWRWQQGGKERRGAAFVLSLDNTWKGVDTGQPGTVARLRLRAASASLM